MIGISAFMLFLATGTGATDSLANCDPEKFAVGRTCGDLRDTAPFSGTVLRREPDGAERPVTRVRFWRGTSRVDGPVDSDSLERVKVKVTPTGWFSLPVVLSYSDVTAYCGGRVIESHRSIESAVFVLRAPGCADLVVPFSVGWHAHSLYMTCGEDEKAQ